MNVEVIAIGDELTSGQRLDTNSRWLSQQLSDIGLRVLYHSTVGDDINANIEVLRNAAQRAEIVVITGGLGPTADDLTRQAMAAAFDAELVTNAAALEHIRQLFASRGREMPDRNKVQAMFPRGSEVIGNPHGTAPGIYQRVTRRDGQEAHLFALPGVPAEMREMWFGTVRPRLVEMLGSDRRIIQHHCVRCFGVGESELEQMLPDLVRRGRSPAVGITVSQATITLRISAEAPSESACQALIEPTLDTIHSCLGELVFGSGEDELQHAVVRLLAANGRSLATVEDGSGGLLSDWLSGADGSGEVFRGGIVVHKLDGWSRLSNQDTHDNDVSRLVAAGAAHVRSSFAADLGLAVGPFPTDEAATDTVELALATAGGILSRQARFTGHPDILKARTTKQALNLLRLHLQDG